MIRRPPRSTRTDTLFPYTTLFRSVCTRACAFCNVKTGMPRAVDSQEPQHVADAAAELGLEHIRSEEHTSELQSLMRISYAVFCLKKTKTRSRTELSFV